MQTIKEIIENKEKPIDKCKYCGKEFKPYSQVVFQGTPNEKVLSVYVPACNCVEIQRQKLEQEKEAEETKNKLARKFENSVITPYFKKKTFKNLLEKSEQYGNSKELKQLQEYANSFNSTVEKTPGVFLLGKPGTGKTTMAAAVCNELIERGFNCLFLTFSALIERFAKYSFDNGGDIYPLLMWLVKFDLVVIDDIGRENYTDRRKEIAFRIIDALLNYEVTTIFTANPEMVAKLSRIEDWGAILDRLKDICATQIQFSGNSLRGVKWQLV